MEYISIIKDDVDLSKSHKYLRIPHPRTGHPQLYLPYTSSDGNETILETVKINGSQRRTWFIGDNGIDAGNILLHYPIDPLFLVIPIIIALSSSNNAQSFQPLSDLISSASSLPSFTLPEPFTNTANNKPGQPSNASTGYNKDIESLLKLKSVNRVLKACCEKKVISSIPSSDSSTPKQRYYRPSIPIILNHLKQKIEHFSQPERFEKFDHLVRGLGRDGLLGEDAEELRRLARIQASCEHLSQWLPRSITDQLVCAYDFSPLITQQKNRTAAAIAASQQPTNTSNKDGAAKGTKRKAPPTSKGVEALKKVNTNNMSKLTSFFKPKDNKKK